MNKIAVIIACYKTTTTAVKVVAECLQFADLVICVDDSCPYGTGSIIDQTISSEKLVIIYHKSNLGVGGAVKTGFTYALNHNYTILVKCDSDGQMWPGMIPKLISPIILRHAEFTKGNRFIELNHITNMPLNRLIGNTALGFICKLTTGYWELFDPTNGFIAIHANALKYINLQSLDDRYFFETDLLFRSSLLNIVIKEIPMQADYRNHFSSLNPIAEVYNFGIRHFQVFLKRISYQYFILDFNPGSMHLVGFCFSFILMLLVTINSIYRNVKYSEPTPLGLQVLFLAFLIITLQTSMGFLFYDMAFRPMLRRLKQL